MKKLWPVGLIVEGNITHSDILRMPKLADELGPIKSATIRVARRVSNFLKAGHAVGGYEDLQPAQMVLIRVPDEAVPRIVEEIFAADLELKNLAFVLCESWLSPEALQPLRLRGAAIATALGVPSSRSNWFVVEGDTVAVRHIRRLLEANNARALELDRGGVSLYFAAELLAMALPLPILLAAQSALRSSGISGNNISTLLNEMMQVMFRDLLNGARSTWGGPLARCSEELVSAHIAAVRSADPQLAETIDHQLEWARQRMVKHKAVSSETGVA